MRMNSHKFTSVVDVLMLSLVFLELSQQQQQPRYLHHLCSNTPTFARGSDYHSNLESLLSAFSTLRDAAYDTGYQSKRSGTPPDAAYGYFLCHGSLTAGNCRDCIVFGSKDVLGRCPGDSQAVIWYEECMIRYSNEDFIGSREPFSTLMIWNSQINSNLSSMDTRVKGLVSMLIEMASNSMNLQSNMDSKLIDAASNRRDFQFSVSVQCTRDLGPESCVSCLHSLMAHKECCCIGKQGWRILTASCNIRYQGYMVFDKFEVLPPTASPPPDGSIDGEDNDGDRRSKTIKVVIITLSSIAAVPAILGAGWYLSTRGKRPVRGTHLPNTRAPNTEHFPDGAIIETDEDDAGQEMHYLSFDALYAATDGFSVANKLGEGGFGPVYKGILPKGKVIAVKRLSRQSSQGLTEFKNEVLLIIKLQHRNLVRLLGYCVERDEKLLVYEYMANNSLDSFLFDSTSNKQLGWGTRMRIIHGTARGLQYLHEDSRLKIIHRDLKASNVLLDDEMNPKISDFGTAKIFGNKQIEDSTGRIIGTFGYMSPEYALAGIISEKSDIYSFGVLLLEIVSGKKATRFYHDDKQSSLISYAWQSWCETEGLNMVDEAVADSCTPSEAIRCIHVALLCVQDQVPDRPTISNIVSMLNNDRELPQPKEPKFTFQTTWRKSNAESVSKSEHSKYEFTQSTVEGR